MPDMPLCIVPKNSSHPLLHCSYKRLTFQNYSCSQLLQILLHIVTSEGAAKTTMLALLTGAILNIALDPIFIYTFDLGVAGAAIATAISQVVSTLVYLYYLFSKKSIFRFRLKDCSFSKEIFSEIFKIGVPTLVFQLLTSLSISLINNASGTYGDAAIAGMGVVTRLVSMGSLTVFGFIKGFQPIAGYSYGAKKYE